MRILSTKLILLYQLALGDWNALYACANSLLNVCIHRNPYIKVLSLCTYGPETTSVYLSERAIIPQAYETRFIKGFSVGFAVSHGDDSLASVADWNTGQRWKLTFSDAELIEENDPRTSKVDIPLVIMSVH